MSIDELRILEHKVHSRMHKGECARIRENDECGERNV
jgi:hypothetical protein